MNRLKEREAQVLAVTKEERESADDSNPIIHAETGPCRYRSITYWFPDGDGVIVEENLDTEGEITVKYMHGEESIELTDGPVYDWAIDLYEND